MIPLAEDRGVTNTRCMFVDIKSSDTQTAREHIDMGARYNLHVADRSSRKSWLAATRVVQGDRFMLVAISLSFTLVLATIFIHFESLRWTSIVLPRCAPAGRARVLVVVVGAFTAHMLEVLLYAGAFFTLEHVVNVGGLEGRHGDTFMDYLYYSTVMYTSLGLGDVFPVGHLRLISGIEALNGLLLIGWSTSFTFLAMRRYWPLESIPV